MKRKKFLICLLSCLVFCITGCSNTYRNFKSFKGYDEFADFADEDILPLYDNSNDGVVKFCEVPKYNDIAYDKLTNSIIVNDNAKINIYDCVSFKLKDSFVAGAVDSIQVVDGKIAIFHGRFNSIISLYDIKTKHYEKITLSKNPTEIVLSKKYIFYSFDCYTDYIYKYDIATKQETPLEKFGFIKNALIKYNPEHDILYILNRDYSKGAIYFYDLTNDSHNKWDFRGLDMLTTMDFRGKYLYIDNGEFDGLKLEGMGSLKYVKHDIYDMQYNLYSNDFIYLYKGYNNKLFVYSLENKYIVYGMKINAEKIFEENSALYIVGCEDKKHFALIDLSKIKK